MTRFLAALSAVCGLAMLCTPPSIAATPACVPNPEAETSLADFAFKDVDTKASLIPTAVVVGKKTKVTVYVGMGDDDVGPDEYPRVSVVSATPGVPLQHPFSATYNQDINARDWKAFPDVPVWLEEGESAQIAISVTVDFPFPSTCRATIYSSAISTMPGQKPSPRSPKPGRFTLEEDGAVQGAVMRFKTKKCVGDFTATLRMAGQSLTIKSRDCTRSVSRSGGGGMHLAWDPDDESLRMWVQRQRRFTRKVTYRVAIDGDRIKTGSFRVRSRYHRGNKPRKIFNDTDFDDYVNICINESKNIYAENGRLYCAVGETSSYWYWDIDRLR